MTTHYSAPDIEQLAQEWPLLDKLDLPEGASIVVAGAFEGKLIRLLAERYPDHGRVTGFEPQVWASNRAQDATRDMEDITIRPCGLYAGPGIIRMDMGEWETDACSVLAQGEDSREHGQGIFIDAATSLPPLFPIDLFVMNMEGYEYKLLPYMIGRGVTVGIQRLAVQFHTKYSDGGEFYSVAKLDRLYTRTYDDFPKWVYWTKPRPR